MTKMVQEISIAIDSLESIPEGAQSAERQEAYETGLRNLNYTSNNGNV